MARQPKPSKRKKQQVEAVAGVDAARHEGPHRAGAHSWVVAVTDTSESPSLEFVDCADFGAVWALAQERALSAVAVDMPLGLPEVDGDWRACEDETRVRLKKYRRSVVFRSPSRRLMHDRDAVRDREFLERIDSRDAPENPAALIDPCRDIRDSVPGPAVCAAQASPRLYEVHAELSFWKLRQNRPTTIAKRDPGGVAQRLRSLEKHFAGVRSDLASWVPRRSMSHDYDALDAAAAAYSAVRIALGRAKALGDTFDLDGDGFPKLIWY